MKGLKTMTAGVAAAAAMALAPAPAQAQYYERDRGLSTGEVIAGVAAVAGIAAIASAATQRGGYYDPRYDRRNDRRYGRPDPARFAVETCRREADRRLGRRAPVRVDVRDVQYTRNRVRVLGAAEIGGRGYARYDRRAFTCEVRQNGRVASFRTHNYRW